MKILYTIGRYWPAIGGGELHTRELINNLASRHQSMVTCLRNDNCSDWLYAMTTKPQKKQRPYYDQNVEVRLIRLSFFDRIRLKNKLTGFYSDESHRILCNKMIANMYLKVLREINESFDLVHNVKIGEEFFTLASFLYAREKGIPFIFTPICHPTQRWDGEIYCHLYSNSDGIIALTEAEKSFLVAHGARPERVFIAGTGPLLKSLSPTRDIKADFRIAGPIVLFLAQKYRHKGVAQLLEAAPLVWDRHPDVHFIFAGPRTPRSKELFRGVRDSRIIELGTVSEDDKINLLGGCDIFCLPSTGESFGIVYLEAWSLRKPVIAVETEISKCVINHGNDGLLVNQEASSIADAICTLVEDTAMRNTLGENGYAKVVSRFSWERVSSIIEDAYRYARDNPR